MWYDILMRTRCAIWLAYFKHEIWKKCKLLSDCQNGKKLEKIQQK